MKRSRIAEIFLTICLLLAFTQSANAQRENLLLNGDLESGDSWTAFGETASPVASARTVGETAVSITAYSGSGYQQWTAAGFAGLFQRVPVTPEATLRLEAWANAQATGGWLQQRIGIDPTGGTDPGAAAVKWSQTANFTGEWGRLAVEARAEADYVTVFLSANPNNSVDGSIAYDNAELFVVAFDLPQAQVPPAQAPEVDPLLSGLAVGAGISGGTQGISASPAPDLRFDQKYPTLTGSGYVFIFLLGIAGIGRFLVSQIRSVSAN